MRVQHMDRAAVHVRHQVLAQGGKGMYHSENPLSFLFGIIYDDFKFKLAKLCLARIAQEAFPLGTDSLYQEADSP